MGFGAFAGGLYGAYNGYNNQIELDRKRDREDRQAEIENENLAFQRLQRQRLLDEQARADKFRSGVGGIKQTKEVDVNDPNFMGPSDPGNPATAPSKVKAEVPRRQDEILRDYADVTQQYGNDPMKAFEIRASAEQAALAEASRRMAQVISAAPGKSTADIVREAAKVYNSDPLDGEVANVEDRGPGGAVVTFTNRRTKQTMVKEFKSPEEAISGLRAYLDPAGAQALLAKRQEAELKVWEERMKARAQEQAKPLKGSPGERVEPGVDDPRPGFTVPPLPVRGTGDGSGSGSGKGSKTPYDLAREIMADAFEKGDVKAASPQQRTDAEDYLDRLIRSNPGIPPARAAKLATVAATDPTRATPRIDPKTGQINLDLKDADGATYTLLPGYTTPEELEKRGFDKKAIAESVKQMISAQGDAATQKTFVTAAFDPGAGAKVTEAIKAGAARAIDEAVAKNKASPNPVPEQEIRQRGADMLNQALEANARKLAMVRAYTQPPQTEQARSIPKVAGLPRSQAMYSEWIKAKQDKEKLLSDAAKMSPDRRDVYIANRIDEIEERIRANQNYIGR